MGTFIDLTGQRFGRLVVQSRNFERTTNGKNYPVYWNCVCDCGNKVVVGRSGLKQGNTKSCGCLNRENRIRSGKNNKKYIHFDMDSEEYGIGIMNNGEKFYFDKEDYDKIKDICWHRQKGYVVGHLNGPNVSLHRYILGVEDNRVVDHINHNKLDNRKSNLRICTQSENAKNRTINKNNKSGYTGVSFCKRYGKWMARIKVNYKSITLGYYENINDAIEARKKAEIEYFGEFSNSYRNVVVNHG